MPSVYLSLGSNIDREHNIIRSLQQLSLHFGPLTLSPIYESAAVGFSGTHFYNMVVGFESSLALDELHRLLQQIEIQQGKTEIVPSFRARTIDIDLLLYGDHISFDPHLELPRSDILKYPFVLCPLSDIAPEVLHPVLQQSYRTLWQYSNQSIVSLRVVDMNLVNLALS